MCFLVLQRVAHAVGNQTCNRSGSGMVSPQPLVVTLVTVLCGVARNCPLRGPAATAPTLLLAQWSVRVEQWTPFFVDHRQSLRFLSELQTESINNKIQAVSCQPRTIISCIPPPLFPR